MTEPGWVGNGIGIGRCCSRWRLDHDRHEDRARHHGRSGGTRRPLLGCPDRSQPALLPDRRRTDAARDDPRPGPGQEGGGRGQSGSRPPPGRPGGADRAGGRRGHRRRARRPLPARGLADRQRDPDQHERQRGDRQPGHRARRRGPGLQGPGPPQRRRQPLPVLQRRLPHRDARGRGGVVDRKPAPGPGPPRRYRGGTGRDVCRRRQDRPHPPHGRRAVDRRTGARRLGGPGPRRTGAGRGCPARPPRAPARRHRGRYRPQHPPRLRRAGGGRHRVPHRAAVRHPPAIASRSSPPTTGSSRPAAPCGRWR